MEKNKSESYNNLIGKINPLNLKSSYKDNVVALKILLNLADNSEVRNLGQEILDSYLLLNLLKSNMEIKQYYDEYSYLIKKLQTFINKYMHFEKLIRENEVKTFAFITSNSDELNTQDEKIAAANSFNNDNAYIFINEKSADFSGYSLNSILNESNIFSIILCKDKEKKFKNEIADNILNSNRMLKKIEYGSEVEDLLAIKKKVLIQTITTDDLPDEQIQLFNIIEEEFKELLSLEIKIIILERFIDKLMAHLFVLDPEISKIYKEFKEKCEKDYEISIKLRVKLIEKIKTDLKTYESVLNLSDNEKNIVQIESQERIEYDNKEMIKKLVSFYKEYLLEQINNSSLGKIKLSEYIQKVAREETKLIEYVKANENLQEKEYINYLINKLGSDNPDSFEEYNTKNTIHLSTGIKRAA